MLDDLLRLGLIDPARRPYCEAVAWSTAHGLAVLLLDGPPAGRPDPERDATIAGTLDAIVAGICTGPAAR